MPMPDFAATLLHKIEPRKALCIRSKDQLDFTAALGGVLLGGAPPRGSDQMACGKDLPHVASALVTAWPSSG